MNKNSAAWLSGFGLIFVTIILIRKNLHKDNTNLRYIKVKIIIILISGSWKKKGCPYRV